MIEFYFNLAHNPMKVALLLEELGLPYDRFQSILARESSLRPTTWR